MSFRNKGAAVGGRLEDGCLDHEARQRRDECKPPAVKNREHISCLIFEDEQITLFSVMEVGKGRMYLQLCT
ncbi:hypothetical protein HanRHA438_Chr15g0697631 [Helianthus annuus]|nr:hypothetical protein HanRHA438_Chr15g0697631 [Helianthus annuus]